MNVTLKCLGALRFLVEDEEQTRITIKCSCIPNNSEPSDHGKKYRLQREIFSVAVKYLTESITSGQIIADNLSLK
jgi:hypothetical protein